MPAATPPRTVADRCQKAKGLAASDVVDALTLLRQLHVARNHRPIAKTIIMLFDAVRAHAGIALWPTGVQASPTASG